MKSGKLDRQIVIQQETSITQDGYGQPKGTWTTFATVWAEVIQLTTDERFQSQGTHAARTNKFRIRTLAGLDEKMRIQFDSLNWRILGISEIQRGRGHEVMAEVVK